MKDAKASEEEKATEEGEAKKDAMETEEELD